MTIQNNLFKIFCHHSFVNGFGKKGFIVFVTSVCQNCNLRQVNVFIAIPRKQTLVNYLIFYILGYGPLKAQIWNVANNMGDSFQNF